MTWLGGCRPNHLPQQVHAWGIPAQLAQQTTASSLQARHDLYRFQDPSAHARRTAARRCPPRNNLQPVAAQDKSTPPRTDKAARVEAVLLVAGGAMSTRRLAQLAILADANEAKSLIDKLNESYDRSRSAFSIERVAAGYQLLSRPQFAFWLDTLHNRPATLKLSPPMMETLTIVAYQQPIVRADIEAIRGVQCSEILKQLMEHNLVKVGGEDDSLGRPYLYVTTRKFLEVFGLLSLGDLPLGDTLSRASKPISASSQSENFVDGTAAPAPIPDDVITDTRRVA
ncbi:MAG: SMC-Scp complex subunit ScpB [Planctomycetaceae bacterium]